MKITDIKYERVFNLGDYRSEKIGLSASLDEEEALSPAELIDQLRSIVQDNSLQGRAAAKRSKDDNKTK